jgi:hypothetical protein
LHFQWKDRSTGTIDPDLILFPEDAEFSKVGAPACCNKNTADSCTPWQVDTGKENDRVYILQWKSSSRRFFFWMQAGKDDSKDEETCKQINDAMNNPAAGGEGQGGGMDEQQQLMQMLG